MGRSLRSQTKKRFRAIKRDNIFGPVEDARLQRLAAAQAKDAEKPKIGDFMDEVASAVSKDESKMDLGEGEGGVSNRKAKKLKLAKKVKRQKTNAKKKANKKSTTF